MNCFQMVYFFKQTSPLQYLKFLSRGLGSMVDKLYLEYEEGGNAMLMLVLCFPRPSSTIQVRKINKGKG